MYVQESGHPVLFSLGRMQECPFKTSAAAASSTTYTIANTHARTNLGPAINQATGGRIVTAINTHTRSLSLTKDI